jgi:hypothetical protein
MSRGISSVRTATARVRVSIQLVAPRTLREWPVRWFSAPLQTSEVTKNRRQALTP